MGVSTRSKATKTRTGNVRRSLDKHIPVKKKIHVKSRTKSEKYPVVTLPRALIRHQARSMAINILASITQLHSMVDSIDTALFKFYNFEPTLTRCIERHLQHRTNGTNNQNSELAKLWVYLISEGLEMNVGQTMVVKQLPIIVIVESQVAPINYTCKVSLQTDRKDFFSFDDAGLGWVKNGDVFCLQSRNPFRDPDDMHALLPLKKPSMINSLEPLPVEDVEVEYRGKAILAQTRNDVIHAINLEEDLDLANDLDPLIAAVRAAKQKRREREAGRTLAEKNFFSRMVASLAEENGAEESSVKASLEAMKIYKVYPEYDENLPPPREVFLWLGGAQKKGDVKHAKLDSLYGYVDGYY